ncbi:Xylose transport system permease protein xylH [Serratia rubidaea]|uniref:Xylose transport system permease protein xylH n=1 Tax=Serratia rubidaea TaxID=61652 RepID=A0A4U9HBY9_SERRU|nr:Xylose transport system permease protein xylH [Serratia rubidaea]
MAVVVLGAIYLLNDYRGVPTPVLILTALMLAGIFMASRTAFGPAHLRHRRQYRRGRGCRG